VIVIVIVIVIVMIHRMTELVTMRKRVTELATIGKRMTELMMMMRMNRATELLMMTMRMNRLTELIGKRMTTELAMMIEYWRMLEIIEMMRTLENCMSRLRGYRCMCRSHHS